MADQISYSAFLSFLSATPSQPTLWPTTKIWNLQTLFSMEKVFSHIKILIIHHELKISHTNFETLVCILLRKHKIKKCLPPVLVVEPVVGEVVVGAAQLTAHHAFPFTFTITIQPRQMIDLYSKPRS